MAENELIEWRIRIDIRCGLDQPNSSTVTGLPSTFVGNQYFSQQKKECGWSIYDQRQPDENKLNLTKVIPEDRNPIYNEQFLIPGPTSLHGRGKLFFQN